MAYWLLRQNLTLPNVVQEPGRYVTRGGEVVTIDRLDNFRAHGRYQNGTIEFWSHAGRVLPHYISPNDIVAPKCRNCDQPACEDSERCLDCHHVAYQERQDEACGQ